ncbi:MAG: yecA family protein [Moritella dasanensis]|jgi:yecA family protein
MTDSALSREDEILLSNWLSGEETPKETLSLIAMKGFFFGLVAAPAPVETEDWMDMIFGGAAPSNISDDKLFAIISVYNEISEQVYDSGARLPAECIECANFTDNFKSGAVFNDWSIGFAIGAAFYYESLVNSLEDDSEISHALQMAYLCLSYFSCAGTAQQVADLQQTEWEAFTQTVLDMMPDFIVAYAQVIEQAALASGNYDDEGWEDSELDD